MSDYTHTRIHRDYLAKLAALVPLYRARSKAHLLEMLIDQAETDYRTSPKPPRNSEIA